MKSLSEAKFVKFYDLIGLQETTIMGGCTDVISPPKSLEHHVDGGVLEPVFVLVQHNSRPS